MIARVICVGHAALDRVYRIEAFPLRPTKVRALEHIESGGGMAANASVAIARLGGKAELWSRIGEDDAANRIRDGLRAMKVDVRHVQSFEGARSSTSAIIVDDRGERLIVGMRDTGMPSGTSWLPLERIKEAGAVLVDVRWLEAARAVLEHARKEKVTTILDADLGAREALPELLPFVDYTAFSEPALADFCPRGNIEEKLDSVRRDFGCKHVGVTLGEHGYQWRDEAGGGICPAFRVDVVDTTGAGDAFHGALALMIAEGQPIARAVKVATAVAGLKCTRLGSRAGLPTRADLDAFLGRH
jgi:sulfofructose kinase